MVPALCDPRPGCYALGPSDFFRRCSFLFGLHTYDQHTTFQCQSLETSVKVRDLMSDPPSPHDQWATRTLDSPASAVNFFNSPTPQQVLKLNLTETRFEGASFKNRERQIQEAQSLTLMLCANKLRNLQELYITEGFVATFLVKRLRKQPNLRTLVLKNCVMDPADPSLAVSLVNGRPLRTIIYSNRDSVSCVSVDGLRILSHTEQITDLTNK